MKENKNRSFNKICTLTIILLIIIMAIDSFIYYQNRNNPTAILDWNRILNICFSAISAIFLYLNLKSNTTEVIRSIGLVFFTAFVFCIGLIMNSYFVPLMTEIITSFGFISSVRSLMKHENIEVESQPNIEVESQPNIEVESQPNIEVESQPGNLQNENSIRITRVLPVKKDISGNVDMIIYVSGLKGIICVRYRNGNIYLR